MNKIISFLFEVKAELSKVVWPKKDELIGSSIIVCILSLFFALVLGFMDFNFSMLIKRLLISG